MSSTVYKGLMTTDGGNDCLSAVFLQRKIFLYVQTKKKKIPNWTADISTVLQILKGSM